MVIDAIELRVFYARCAIVLRNRVASVDARCASVDAASVDAARAAHRGGGA